MQLVTDITYVSNAFRRYRVSGELARGTTSIVYKLASGHCARILQDSRMARLVGGGAKARLEYIRWLNIQLYEQIAKLAHGWKFLTQYPHTNILRVGPLVATERGNVGFLCEPLHFPRHALVRTPSGWSPPHPAAHTVGTFLRFGIGLFEGLTHMHRVMRLVHRDVKPANIGIRRRFPRTPVLIDFDLAWCLDEEQNPFFVQRRHRGVVGTPGYMSPEATYYGSAPHPAMDIWSGMVTLASYVTQEHGWRDGPMEVGKVLESVRHGTYPFRELFFDLLRVKSFEPILDSCLRKNWVERPTASEVVRDLTGILESLPPNELSRRLFLS